MNLQWYPGHMTKAKRQMQEDMKLIDVVVELLDARIPLSSRNPDINTLAGGKSRVVLLNKADLADEAETLRWKERLEREGSFVALVNAKSGNGVKNVQAVIRQACQEKLERDRKRGILNRPVRAMIVGIPNVGKSTFINSFAGRACAKTGNKPGVTKGKQWIRLNKSVELLDTPGILWPKFEDPQVGKNLAFIGSIRDEVVNTLELALELISYLTRRQPGLLTKKYEIEEGEDAVLILTGLAVRRGCKRTGDEADLEKAAALLLDDFRNGRLGPVTLEQADNGGSTS